MATPDALILLAHGSRDPLWQAPLQAMADRLRQLRPGLPVRCAFLEWATPDLPAAVAQVLTEGAHAVHAVRIVPVFIGLGKHARHDLPRQVAALCARHPGVAFELQPALGERPELIDLASRLALAP